MTATAESRTFAWDDLAARAFLVEHGYVVVTDVLGPTDRAAIRGGWNDLVAEAAARVDLPAAEFVERFPQNRDLWRKHPAFTRLLFETRQADVARRLLAVTSVRLFHDHAISKPVVGSGSIPWHQDSAYWPLDRVGLSLWSPDDEVDADGGCLEVLAGSHRDGPRQPQDFLAGEMAVADDDPRRVALPVAGGATVILSGLTWHRSAPNRSQRPRLAYLTLWVPSAARFVPEHAGWHPTAAHIAVPAGALLDGDWFPRFGDGFAPDEGEYVSFPIPAATTGPSMFTASRDIARQLGWVVDRPAATLAALLAEHSVDDLALRVLQRGLVEPTELVEVRDILAALALQDRVRRESVARDVYLRTVERWWTVVGARIAEAARGG